MSDQDFSVRIEYFKTICTEDDCLGQLVPSDLRQLLATIAQQEKDMAELRKALDAAIYEREEGVSYCYGCMQDEPLDHLEGCRNIEPSLTLAKHTEPSAAEGK